MSRTFEQIRALIACGELRISLHGYEELAADGILARDVVAGIQAGTVVEEYPEYAKGPCVLVLQYGEDGRPIHALWGIPAGQSSPAVLITAYRPDPARWDDSWLRRRT